MSREEAQPKNDYVFDVPPVKKGIVVTKRCFTCGFREKWPDAKDGASKVTLNLSVNHAGLEGVFSSVGILPRWLVCKKCGQPTISLEIELEEADPGFTL